MPDRAGSYAILDSDGKIDTSQIRTATIDLTSAQIATLEDVVVDVVPAPGAGFMLIPHGLPSFDFKPGTIGFARDVVVQFGHRGGIRLFGTGYDLEFSSLSRVAGPLMPFSVGNPDAPTDIRFNIQQDITDVENRPLSIRCNQDPLWRGAITSSEMPDSGSLWLVGDTFVIDGDSQDTEGWTVDSVSNSYAITAVNAAAAPAGSFTVAGDQSGAFTATDLIVVYRSTGNNGQYTVTSATFDTDHTVILVDESVPDGTVDGYLGNQTSSNVGSLQTYTPGTPGTAYKTGSHSVTSDSPSEGVNAAINVLTTSEGSDGTARVTVDYRIVALL